jgi:hydroxymethylglutaryl-CoA lyase
MAEFVEIVEVGPRDGLQNEKRPVPAVEKIALVDLLSQVGFRRIEVTSFVSPAWVPQLADAAEVMAGIARRPGTLWSVLAPNLRGYHAARAAGADEVAVFVSASEGFSRANLNASVSESLARLAPLAEAAREDAMPLRGYISMVVDCPFDGPTDPAAVARVAAALRDLGCHEIALGDTLGRATPDSFARMLVAVTGELPVTRLAVHCHDTAGRALEVIDAALEQGVRVVDAAVGGLGGCPYAPGAAGNVATEAVTAHLARRGYATGLDAARLAEAAALAQRLRTG